MADDIKVEPSSKKHAVSVATDEIDNTHHPLYKMEFGADGEANLVSKNNPLPTTMANLNELMNELVPLQHKILKELQIMNLYNAMAHNQELTKEDVT